MRKLTPSTDQRTRGFTLVELPLAMSILLIILGLVLTAFTGALGQQRSTETAVNLDASLRRTSQIITQDLRNSAYGLITSQPYASASTSISVARLTDTAVHSVTSSATLFTTSTSVEVITPPGFSWPAGTRFLLINPTPAQKTATSHVLTTAVTTSGTVNLTHATTLNTICYSPDNLVQRINLVGYSLNPTQKILYRSSQGVETPLAYGVSNFTVTYIDTSGTSYTRMQDMPPSATLARVGLRLDMERPEKGGVRTRGLSSSIEIPKMFTLTNAPLKYIVPNSSVTC
ncbi:prepilin-type N-terminal cleavage/methylation domain-containing protein [Deinococcus soli (ex Cha et al. 2016)]|uniref:Prepilin-type N-terminal cleavage/methylation domain-containing protein n=2 Tax=Deinococcus soli (ex Cha et al. 2016) TaxID=1309411 RepID=A0ACC6KGQ5_9DEIO|nr:prepilin-type N-terminal cleavage/methylation domain-containing protein [Deinococcus soli (ex Cha et al. 2016)]MDR6218969.1 prepilin-type N-terminal cleavage/methylation domain-containing protein [Deinococcus soli (ex Cha et al. 2016)]MDR6328766.1 prepilin-type N-terminal cleavage/methylation domain-containing protein [Deinococcus soli (ex Cha et al. 2016)]MDR6751747.1 prepilin-type N-terminal cleavage/methylation domain-containing protein [Deinococcus soli (ex Cha et al. 2016)]